MAVHLDQHGFVLVSCQLVCGGLVERERAVGLVGAGIDLGKDRERADGVDAAEALELADELTGELTCLIELVEGEQCPRSFEVEGRKEDLVAAAHDERKAEDLKFRRLGSSAQRNHVPRAHAGADLAMNEPP